MNLDNVAREDWLVAGLALLLAIFLVVLPWFDDPLYGGLSAINAPDAWLGVVAVVACVVIVADVAVQRFSPEIKVPAIGDRPTTRAMLTVVVAVFVALKFIFRLHFNLFGWGFYIDVLTTAALVYFALQVKTAATAGVNGVRSGSSAQR